MSNIFWCGKNLLLGYDEDYLSVRVFFFFFFFFFFLFSKRARVLASTQICHLNLIEKLRFLKRPYADKFWDRSLKFSGLARYILKTKTAKFQLSNLSEKWNSRWPIFDFYVIVYNSAGEFSTFVENFFREGRLFGRVVGGLRPPPPLTGQRRGLRPLLGPGKGALLGTGKGDGGVFSPVALASAIINRTRTRFSPCWAMPTLTYWLTHSLLL